MSGPAEGFATDAVRGLLADRGWTLRRAEGGSRPRFLVCRDGGKRAVCALAFEAEPGAENSLMPSARLRVVSLDGAPLSAKDREGAAELAAALAPWLEARFPREAAAPSGSGLAEIHEGNFSRSLLLRTTFACNQRCPICFVPLTGKPAAMEDIERALDAQAARSGGGGELTLSGGEPASDPRLLDIVAAARRRGFRRIVLQTNGVYLARPGFAAKLAEAGATSFLYSFHSHEEPSYDRITGSRGQFSRAVAGLRALLATPGCRVTVNVVVNQENYRLLPELVDFLAGLAGRRAGAARPELYFSMMNEIGHQNTPSWAVPLEEAAPFLRRAVARCRKAGFSVSRSADGSSFPACQYEQASRHASQRELPQDRVRYGEPPADAPVGRAKSAHCRGCAYDARCLGVPASYAVLFGTKSLKPAGRGKR